MATPITRGSHPKALWPGVHAWWGQEYDRYEPIWPKIFSRLTSEKAYEEDVEEVGFGLLSVKPEGASITYDSAHQGPVSRYTHITYASGFIVTFEEWMDNLYPKLSFKRSQKLAKSVFETEEVVHANVFNRGFNSSFTGGDGKELFSTAHPTDSGDQSNHITVAADISEAAIEDLCIQIKQATDARGLRQSLKPRCLYVPVELEFEANRIVKSVLQNDTANNAVNVIKMLNMFPDGIIASPYLTDADAWFIKTDALYGLQHFDRMKPAFEQDGDFDTHNLKHRVIARWSQGWSDWRSCYGSPGA